MAQEQRQAQPVCGIYAIVNTVNGKRYYGSSVDIYRRKAQHWSRLRRGQHHSIHLQRAWNKHGEAAFAFVIIQKCQPEEVLDVEQSYLDANRNGYNINPFADGHALSEETKRKIGDGHRGMKHSDATKELLRQAARKQVHRTGFHLTEETKAKLRAKKLGGRASPETRAKLSAVRKGRRLTAHQRATLIACNKARVWSAASRAKLAESNHARPLEMQEAFIYSRRGTTNAPEDNERRRVAMLGRQNSLGMRHTPEAKEKIRQASLAMHAARRLARQQQEAANVTAVA